ncbi:ATP-binding cassette domain-containing protein [Salana multivorans]
MASTSGGERQLTGLARALAQEAPVLILDEPISALDMAHEMAVLRLLRPWLDTDPEHRSVVVVPCTTCPSRHGSATSSSSSRPARPAPASSPRARRVRRSPPHCSTRRTGSRSTSAPRPSPGRSASRRCDLSTVTPPPLTPRGHTPDRTTDHPTCHRTGRRR